MSKNRVLNHTDIRRLLIFTATIAGIWAVLIYLARFNGCVNQRHAVVQVKSGGRFGDNLVSLAHAIYFAQKNNFELLYDPFTYSDQLVLSDSLPRYARIGELEFDDVIEHYGGSTLVKTEIKNDTKKLLFKIPYFPEAPIEYKISNNNDWKAFPIDWFDHEFQQTLRTLFAPKHALNLITPPKDIITVAVHVRQGGSFDTYPREVFHRNQGLLTYKIPYEEFYIERIKQLSTVLGHVPLYVFLFTDDENPQALVQRYISKVNIPSIQFDCRVTENRHDMNVLEDFFSMLNFDCLIRSESSYSIMAEKLGDFSIVISAGELLPGTFIQPGEVNIRKPVKQLFHHSSS